MATSNTKVIKEIVTDVGGNTTIEYSDDTTQKYNVADVVTAQVNPLTGGISLLAGGVEIAIPRKSENYHFHGYAPNQLNSDTKFYDYSGALNDGVFQTHLTPAVAWSNQGFISQVNPTVASNLQLIQIPALTFDWLGGESFLLFWRGKATPEAGDVPIFADTTGSTSGIKINVTATGKAKINIYQQSGGVVRYGLTSTSTVFDASSAHSFGVVIDGLTGKHCMWSDGVRDASSSTGLGLFSGGLNVDTINASTFKIGGDGGTASSIQNGIACQHQALVILKGRRGLGIPALENLDMLMANLHRNPQPLVSSGSW